MGHRTVDLFRWPAPICVAALLQGCGINGGDDVWRADFYNSAGAIEYQDKCTRDIWLPDAEEQSAKSLDRKAKVRFSKESLKDGVTVYSSETIYSDGRYYGSFYTNDRASCLELYNTLFNRMVSRREAVMGPLDYTP